MNNLPFSKLQTYISYSISHNTTDNMRLIIWGNVLFFSTSCYNGDLWVYCEYAPLNSFIKVGVSKPIVYER